MAAHILTHTNTEPFYELYFGCSQHMHIHEYTIRLIEPISLHFIVSPKIWTSPHNHCALTFFSRSSAAQYSIHFCCNVVVAGAVIVTQTCAFVRAYESGNRQNSHKSEQRMLSEWTSKAENEKWNLKKSKLSVCKSNRTTGFFPFLAFLWKWTSENAIYLQTTPYSTISINFINRTHNRRR